MAAAVFTGIGFVSIEHRPAQVKKLIVNLAGPVQHCPSRKERTRSTIAAGTTLPITEMTPTPPRATKAT